VLRELAGRGIETSNLYPASLPLYRRAGYEIAGHRWEIKVALAHLPRRALDLAVRKLQAERAAVQACYREMARAANGWLDRGPYVWQRVFEPRGERARALVGGDGADVDGYTVVFEKRGAGGAGGYVVVGTDLCARTPAAVALLALFADHGNLGVTVTWYGSPGERVRARAPGRRLHGPDAAPVDVRLVDVPRAPRRLLLGLSAGATTGP
jgi:predicted acetyltransferase